MQTETVSSRSPNSKLEQSNIEKQMKKSTNYQSCSSMVNHYLTNCSPIQMIFAQGEKLSGQNVIFRFIQKRILL